MLPFIERIIEKRLKKRLHEKNKRHIRECLCDYRERNPKEDYTELKKHLESELARIYTKIDSSIIKERILPHLQPAL